MFHALMVGSETLSRCRMLTVTLLTFLPGEHKAVEAQTLAWKARTCADVKMGAYPHQISFIFLWLTRLSTSQRYELIKGVFHTATTRTSVLITAVPNMQSQGQGEDCYIC